MTAVPSPAERLSVWFEGPRRIAVRRGPVPEPRAGEARVRTSVSAISAGTELAAWRGDLDPALPRDETLGAHTGGSFRFPFPYGYASVGRLETLGPDTPAGGAGGGYPGVRLRTPPERVLRAGGRPAPGPGGRPGRARGALPLSRDRGESAPRRGAPDRRAGGGRGAGSARAGPHRAALPVSARRADRRRTAARAPPPVARVRGAGGGHAGRGPGTRAPRVPRRRRVGLRGLRQPVSARCGDPGRDPGRTRDRGFVAGRGKDARRAGWLVPPGADPDCFESGEPPACAGAFLDRRAAPPDRLGPARQRPPRDPGDPTGPLALPTPGRPTPGSTPERRSPRCSPAAARADPVPERSPAPLGDPPSPEPPGSFRSAPVPLRPAQRAKGRWTPGRPAAAFPAEPSGSVLPSRAFWPCSCRPTGDRGSAAAGS